MKIIVLMLLSNPFMVDPRVYNEATSLISAGHKVTIIVWDRKKNYTSEDNVDGVQVIRVHNSKMMKLLPHDLFRNPFWWWHALKIGIKLFRNGFEFDVVHCHDLDTLVTGYFLKKKFGVKLIYDAHEIFGYMIEKDLPSPIVWLTFFMEKIIIRNVNHLITVNQPLFNYFSTIYHGKITIIMNCKNSISEEYTPIKKREFTIIYIGLLTRSRMFPELVDIIGNIEGVKFIIAGKKENIYEIVKEKSKFYKNIEFLGPIPHHEVIPRTLGAHAIICLFNPDNVINKVGLPNKIFEAMATGRPIIVTRDLYLSDFVKDNNCGIEVEYTPSEVRKAIIYLRDNLQLCELMGRNGFEAAKNKYNWKNQSIKLINLYKEL